MVGSGSQSQAEVVERLRARIGRIGGGTVAVADAARSIRFGMDAIDRRLPGGGLRSGVLHEMLGQGADTEHGTVASLLVGGLLARHGTNRQVLWAMQGSDLHAPGLAAVGLHPHRLMLAQCGRNVLAVMEEALRHPGLAAVVGEVEGRLGLTASRRLQLAAEASGVTAFAIRRSRRFDDPALQAPSAAVSRWRIAALPQAAVPATARPPTTELDTVPGRALWRLELLRCREASPFHWIVQACDDQGRLDDTQPCGERLRDRSWPAPDRLPLAAALADRPAEVQVRQRHG